MKNAESEQIPAYEFALEALSLAQELLLVSSSPYRTQNSHVKLWKWNYHFKKLASMGFQFSKLDRIQTENDRYLKNINFYF
jgi:hypothetical protein